jgi:ABC-2 type transport system permease protein
VLNAFSGWAPASVVNTVAGLSMLANFDGISRGVLDAVNIVYFASVIALFLFANAIFVGLYKAR